MRSFKLSKEKAGRDEEGVAPLASLPQEVHPGKGTAPTEPQDILESLKRKKKKAIAPRAQILDYLKNTGIDKNFHYITGQSIWYWYDGAVWKVINEVKVGTLLYNELEKVGIGSDIRIQIPGFVALFRTIRGVDEFPNSGAQYIACMDEHINLKTKEAELPDRDNYPQSHFNFKYMKRASLTKKRPT